MYMTVATVVTLLVVPLLILRWKKMTSGTRGFCLALLVTMVVMCTLIFIKNTPDQSTTPNSTPDQIQPPMGPLDHGEARFV